MRHVAWARRAGSFATRLVLAVLVTACLIGAAQSVLASRLAVRAMERDAVSGVVDVAAGAQVRVLARTADGAPDLAADRAALAADVADLAVERGVPTAEVVAPPADDRPQVVRQDDGDRELLVVTAPVHLRSGPVGLRVSLDAAEARDRSAALRRSLLVVIAVGAASAVPLVLLLGGRRLLRRHRREVLLSGTDDLTGVGSRRAFPVDLGAWVGAARAAEEPLSVVLAEVHGLSVVTAAVGRRRADATLTDVAALLHKRHPNRVYRLGGSVFAVVVPRIGADDAFLLADALRAEVADRTPPLALTLGVAGLDDRCTDAETLLIAADAALDEARSLGVNRVVGPGDGAFGLRWLANGPGE